MAKVMEGVEDTLKIVIQEGLEEIARKKSAEGEVTMTAQSTVSKTHDQTHAGTLQAIKQMVEKETPRLLNEVLDEGMFPHETLSFLYYTDADGMFAIL